MPHTLPGTDFNELQSISLTNGIRIVWGHTDAGQPVHLNQVAGQSVVLYFMLAGAVVLSVEGLEHLISIRANQHNLLYPAGRPVRVDSSLDQPCQFLQLQIPVVFFVQPSALDGPGLDSPGLDGPGLDSPALHHLAELIRAHQPAWLALGHLSVTPAIHTIVGQITKCPLTCSLKQLFLEAKVLELLALQLVQYEQYSVGSETDAFGPDYTKLVEARRLLETHFHNPPTLPELSRLVGLNEYKLKKGFKLVFGETIYNWVLTYRLGQAYQLLQSQQLSISEIAYQVGYQHPAHFTTAFKKKFGVVPSQLVSGHRQ